MTAEKTTDNPYKESIDIKAEIEKGPETTIYTGGGYVSGEVAQQAAFGLEINHLPVKLEAQSNTAPVQFILDGSKDYAWLGTEFEHNGVKGEVGFETTLDELEKVLEGNITGFYPTVKAFVDESTGDIPMGLGDYPDKSLEVIAENNKFQCETEHFEFEILVMLHAVDTILELIEEEQQ